MDRAFGLRLMGNFSPCGEAITCPSANSTSRRHRNPYVRRPVIRYPRMSELVVRRTGNSLAVVIPRALVDRLKLRPGDHVRAVLERTPALDEFDGILKGKSTADELSRIADEGEDLG